MSELFNYLVQNEESFRRARLPALYSDFRALHSTNPDGFAANVSAWKQALSSALLAGKAPSRSTSRNHFALEIDDQLLRSLETKQYGRPIALGAVLQDAVSNGEMIPLQTFLKMKESVYHRSWAAVPWDVLSWGLRKAGLVGGVSTGDDKVPKGSFVVLANLEAAARTFSDKTADLQTPFERTFSKAHFQREYGNALLDGQRLSEADMEVLLRFLSRDKGLIATDGHTVRIRAAGEDSAVAQEDAAIASLKQLMEDLTVQTTTLSKRVDELAVTAQDAVRRKNMVAARAALRSKKMAEGNLTTRYATLAQLEDVAAKIQQAADNVALVSVMQSSTGVLKNLNKKVGGVEKVDEVFDNLREQMGEVDEVGNIIADAGPKTVVDEDEVEDEFEQMLEEERKKEEEAERKKRELEQEKEAEKTRQKLAELEKLGPVGDLNKTTGEPQKTEGEGCRAPPTPVTSAADKLDDLTIDTEDAQAVRQKAEPVLAE